MIFYTPFERSRQVLTLFVVFDIDQTFICRKNLKNMENKKIFRVLGLFRNIPSFSKFRRNIPAKKVQKFRKKTRNIPEFRLLGIPRYREDLCAISFFRGSQKLFRPQGQQIAYRVAGYQPLFNPIDYMHVNSWKYILE